MNWSKAMNKEERLYKLSQGSDTAVWAHDEIIRQVERIAELEEALKLTNDELSKTIDEVNNSLKFNICSSDIDDPWYWDKQTCHENQILLKEQGE